MYFYQYVQSFSPDEEITPELANAVGLELAEYFKGYEVLVATHLDASHLHNHLVINSVSFETGLKLQEGPDSLLKLRKLSDEICLAHNLTVLPLYERGSADVKGLNAREYRAAEKGDSWKFKLMGAIDQSMAASRTKTDFIDNMAVLGYQVSWTPTRKHITFTAPDGRKCRDNKLHEEKYLKERMEAEFGHREAEAIEQAGRATGKQAGRPAGRISCQAEPVRHSAGNAGALDDADIGHRRGTGVDKTADRGAAGVGADQNARESGLSEHSGLTEEGYNGDHSGSRVLRRQTAIGTGRSQEGYHIGSVEATEATESRSPGGTEHEPQSDPASLREKSSPVGTEAEMDRRGVWGGDDILSAAHALENLININPQQKKKDKPDDLQGREKETEKKEDEKKQKKEQEHQQMVRKRKRNREWEWER